MESAEQKETFGRWLVEYEKLIFKVVCAYTRDPGDQDDLFQEISLQVWKSIPKFRGDSAETTWIYRVALNTAMTWSKKEHKRQKQNQSLESTTVLRAPETQDPRLTWLYEQIHQLNPADRSLLLLFLDGYSYREMVDILGISESNVGVKINRLKKQLINKLEQENKS